MNAPNLAARLLAAADLVRRDSIVADVGSDHAYLPIYLCLTGKIRGAVASDVNEGPLARAMINVKEYHLEKRISLLLADGLAGIEKYSPDDIVICGMGGELITEILKKAPWTKNGKIRLILQPMTHADKLRAYLADNGYSVIDEKLVKEEKIYQLICAEYTGTPETCSELELIFGKHNIRKDGEVFREYAEYVRRVFLTRYEGKRRAEKDASEEERVISDIDRLLNKNIS